jgi:hypothetical protein
LDIQATWNNTASPTTCSTIVYASFNLVEEGEQTSIQYRAQNCARKSIRREILQSLTLPTRVPSTHSTSFPGSKSSSVVPPTFRSPTSRSRSHNKCPIIGLFCLALEHTPFLLHNTYTHPLPRHVPTTLCSPMLPTSGSRMFRSGRSMHLNQNYSKIGTCEGSLLLRFQSTYGFLRHGVFFASGG